MADHEEFDARARRIADLRITYDRGSLLEAGLAPTPLAQFSGWLTDAVEEGVVDPNGMVLSTVSAEGQPSARSVLLKDADDRGFTFFSYRGSRKAADLAANAQVALVFPWYALHRQVVVAGVAEPLPVDEVVGYFRSRPHGSQVGAHTCRQSQVIDGRAPLEEHYLRLLDQYPVGVEVPVPDVWAGWLVRPTSIEFWQGRPSRLHDRLRVRWTRSGPAHLASADGWVVERLSP